MGKLTIKVVKCSLLSPAGLEGHTVNPKVYITVDNTYRFQTHLRKNTFEPTYNETFTIDNTHKLASIEVAVYDESRDMFSTITKLMAGDDGKEVTMENARNVAQQTDTSKVLVGKCFLSIRRLVQGQKKRRTYMLGTLNEKKWNGSLFDVFDSPEGVAGSITMEIESDTLGEPASEFRLNDSLESEMSSRLLRLLLSYDPPRVAVLDLILANVYDTSESVSKQGSTPSRRARPNNMVEVAVGPNQLHFTEPTVTETFEQLLTRWCQKYGGGPQLQPFRAQITVDGCTNLDTKLWKTKVFGSNEVYVVLRTEMESFVTGAQKLDETVVWSQGNQVTFTVPNPLTTMLLVVLYGESGSRRFEIGRCQLSFVALAREHTSLRNMFLLNGASVMISEVNAMIRLTMRPLNFGMTSMNQIDYVDEFYDRMNKFLRRYNPYALPQVDTFIRSRLNNLEDYMQELVVQHGREPGSAKIVLTLEAIYSLLADCDTELDGHDIQVIVTFGNVEMKSKVYGVRRYAGVKIGEVFQFDVVRETDMMRIDVIRASNPNMVYGRVDFTCLDIQKGVQNKRTFHLVGAPETEEAYFCGVVHLSLYSTEIGRNHKVDERISQFFAGRLRRYVFRRIPQHLHRVNLALTTVFDMETLMAQLSSTYGEEDPTYAIFFTITSCRQLKQRFGGVSPYVVVRVGIDAYQTKVVKDCTEPDYFELSEFYIDRPYEEVISIIVMDRYDIGNDQEIGHADIPLKDLRIGEPYHDFVLLQAPNPKDKERTVKMKDIGSIGFKYTVMDLNLVDRTRSRLVQDSIRHRRETKHLTHAAMAPLRTLSSVEREDTEKTDENGNRISEWRKRIAPRKFTLFGWGGGGAQKQNTAHAKTPSFNSALEGPSSDDQQSLVTASSLNGSDAGHRPAPLPTTNIMDDGIMGIEDFCSSNASSRMVSQVNSDDDFYEQQSEDEEQEESPKELTHSKTLEASSSTAWKVHARLRVRVLYCRNLFSAQRHPPNPYLAVSTLRETHCTSTQLATLNPRYNEEFEFSITEPFKDVLQVTVLTDTPFGAKKLGQCSLSLLNVQNGVGRTRWASLVVNAHTKNAVEHGSVCLSLTAENFGLNYVPNESSEARLRGLIREHLIASVPRQLHFLEVFVGECSSQETLFQTLFNTTLAKNVSKGGSSPSPGSIRSTGAANVALSVKSIDKLHINGVIPQSVSCFVKVKLQRKVVAKTPVQVGEKGRVLFEGEPSSFVVDDPAAALLRLVIYAGASKEKIGECFITLIDLYKGEEQVRTHYLTSVNNEKGGPVAIGLITVGVLSDNFGTSSKAPHQSGDTFYSRIARFFYYYCPNDLSVAHVKYATTMNSAMYIKRLVQEYGPEPANYKLKVTIRRCDTISESEDERKSSSSRRRLKKLGSNINLFCLLSCGLDEARTSIVRSKSNEFVFYEVFNVSVGLPQQESLYLRLMSFSSAESKELGRASISLDRLERGKSAIHRLPLVFNAESKNSSIIGTAEIELFTEDFGIVRTTTNSDPDGGINSPLSPFQLKGHSTYFCLPTGDQQSTCQESSLRADQTFNDFSYSPDLVPSKTLRRLPDMHHSDTVEETGTTTAMAKTTILPDRSRFRVKFKSFLFVEAPEKELLLRVTDRKDEALLRTKVFANELRNADKADLSFMVENVALDTISDLRYTVKLSVNKVLRSRPLTSMDFCLCNCDYAAINTRTLRMYNSEDYSFMGLCHLEIVFPDFEGEDELATGNLLPHAITEPIIDDVAALFQLYNPKDLSHLDPTVFKSGDPKALHRLLRQQLAPGVLASVYCAIMKVDLTAKVTAHRIMGKVGNFVSHVDRVAGKEKVLPAGMYNHKLSQLSYPMLRVDISARGADVMLNLILYERTVKGKLTELGLARASLRALLSPKVYTMSETVELPVVSIRRAANRIDATYLGTIAIALFPPAYESYPSPVRFSSNSVNDFDRDYVRYYEKRIFSFLKHYDANSLLNYHSTVYDEMVAKGGWKAGLPQYMMDLEEKWGPEKETFGPPPPLQQ